MLPIWWKDVFNNFNKWCHKLCQIIILLLCPERQTHASMSIQAFLAVFTQRPTLQHKPQLPQHWVSDTHSNYIKLSGSNRASSFRSWEVHGLTWALLFSFLWCGLACQTGSWHTMEEDIIKPSCSQEEVNMSTEQPSVHFINWNYTICLIHQVLLFTIASLTKSHEISTQHICTINTFQYEVELFQKIIISQVQSQVQKNIKPSPRNTDH